MSESITLDEAAEQAWTDLMGTVGDNPEEGTAETTDPDDNDPDEGGPEDDDLDDLDESYQEDEDSDEDDELEDEGEDEDPAAPDAIELSEDDVIRLPGVEGDLKVKDAVLFQQGFTKKAQALAKEQEALQERTAEVEQAYTELQAWVEQRAANPVGFAREILSSTQDKTYAAALLLKEMAAAGDLDPAFVETFGLKAGKVADLAEAGQEKERLSAVEQALQQQHLQQAQAQRQQALVQHYLGQWAEVKAGNGLNFESAQAERDAWQQVVQFAAEKQIVDLRHAYVVMTHEGATPQQGANKGTAAAKRKRAQRVVARKSTSGSAKQAGGRQKSLTTDEAISEALSELRSRGA